MTGSEVLGLQRQPVYSCGSFSSFLSEKCNRVYFLPLNAHTFESYTSPRIRLELGIALLRSHACTYNVSQWTCVPTKADDAQNPQKVLGAYWSRVFLYCLGIFLWLTLIFIINTTLGICKFHDSIMKTKKKAVPKGFSFKYLDRFNWRVLKTTREMGYTQAKTLLPLATANLGDSRTCECCSSKQSIEMDWTVTVQLLSKQTLMFRVAASQFSSTGKLILSISNTKANVLILLICSEQ